MRNRNYRHIGRRVHRAVRDAIRSGNFEEIGRVVDDGIHEFTECGNEVLDSLRMHGRRPHYHYTHNASQGGAGQTGADNCRPSSVYNDTNLPSAFRSRMPGSISGFVYTVIGAFIGIPMAVIDIAAFIVGMLGGMLLSEFTAAVSVLTPFACAAIGLMAHGIILRRRARRFTRYRDAIGGASFCMVGNLADTAGETQERTKKDLKKMIACGACPHGHFDQKETCFMVDDQTYDEYLEVEKAYKARTEAERTEEQKEQKDPKEAELAAAIKEGNEYLLQIRAVNEALPGEVISKKLDRLEKVTARIFACVRQHPEKLHDIRRFIRYYMPTTLKLVKSYEEFESQPVQGENITKAEKEIERALDTINTAFENLLDTLFADDALDISTDISTLETMLKQEGLTGSDFEKTSDDGKLS